MITHASHADHDMGRVRFDERALEVGDHAGKWRAEGRWWKVFFALALFGAGAARGAWPAESEWRLWLDPVFLRAPGPVEISGAKRTWLAVGYLSENGLTPWTEEDRRALGDNWAYFQMHALENTAADVAKTKVEYVRDAQKVIEYAVVRSPEGLVPSAVLAPKFLAQFSETLGPTVVLLVPNRRTAYVFPRLATTWQERAPLIVAAYHSMAVPVSLEIFELSPQGLKAIGVLADPARPDQ